MALNYKGIANKTDPNNNFSKPGTVLYNMATSNGFDWGDYVYIHG